MAILCHFVVIFHVFVVVILHLFFSHFVSLWSFLEQEMLTVTP